MKINTKLITNKSKLVILWILKIYKHDSVMIVLAGYNNSLSARRSLDHHHHHWHKFHMSCCRIFEWYSHTFHGSTHSFVSKSCSYLSHLCNLSLADILLWYHRCRPGGAPKSGQSDWSRTLSLCEHSNVSIQGHARSRVKLLTVNISGPRGLAICQSRLIHR